MKEGLTDFIIERSISGFDNNQIFEQLKENESKIEFDGTEETIKRRIRSITSIIQRYNEKRDKENIEKDTSLIEENKSENELSLCIKSYSINDITGLKKWANIPDDWKCVSQKIRASQNKSNPWFIVQGTFQPKQREDFTAEEIAQRCYDEVSKYQPVKKKFNLSLKSGEYMLEISLPDEHLGDRNYINSDTLEMKKQRHDMAVEDFLSQTNNYTIDEIVYTVGSDFFTINADRPETKKGTFQDINYFYDEIYSFGAKIHIDTIYELSKKARRVKVVGILGNHDEQSAIWLMIVLKHKFENFKNIDVDWIYDQRKYHRFGSTVLAFTHKLRKGLHELPLIMLQEMIEKSLIDSGVKYYEIHGGDKHIPNKQELPAETTSQKITQRVLSSLTDNSRWAHDNFGKKVIEGQAFLYHKEKGIKNCMVYRPDF